MIRMKNGKGLKITTLTLQTCRMKNRRKEREERGDEIVEPTDPRCSPEETRSQRTREPHLPHRHRKPGDREKFFSSSGLHDDHPPS